MSSRSTHWHLERSSPRLHFEQLVSSPKSDPALPPQCVDFGLATHTRGLLLWGKVIIHGDVELATEVLGFFISRVLCCNGSKFYEHRARAWSSGGMLPQTNSFVDRRSAK